MGCRRQRWATQLEPILTVWGTLSQTKGLLREARPEDEANSKGRARRHAALSPDADLDPISTFVLFECGLAHRLARLVHASVDAISKVLRGTDLLTSQVQSWYLTLVRGWDGIRDPRLGLCL